MTRNSDLLDTSRPFLLGGLAFAPLSAQPPAFTDSAFDVAGTATAITIELRY